ncbi:hypothetical protein HYV80_02935 [Candidatus Woesearchaeota archaeon]|nr:hypothetical protein [Candidatus Woesearchaeota archaeon]
MKKILFLLIAMLLAVLPFAFSLEYARDDHGKVMDQSTTASGWSYGWLVKPNKNITLVNATQPTNTSMTRAYISKSGNNVYAETTDISSDGKTFYFTADAFMQEGVEHCIVADAGKHNYSLDTSLPYNLINVNITGRCYVSYGSAPNMEVGGQPRVWQEIWSYENVTTLNDTTPPEITYYNLTSSDNGCENWNTNKNTACSTSSVTPTVQFNTSENAWCAVAGSSSSISLNLNYTDMGSSRNCTGDASGEGTREHFCTLTNQDELVYDTSYLFISCKNSGNNQNATSTSSALKLSITGLEAAGRTSIGLGIQNALLSGYINYTDLQIYARNLSNDQVRGTFDRAAKKGSKMWAFNRIGVSDSYVNMFNLTPVLYTLELANKTSSNITLQVEQLINATK